LDFWDGGHDFSGLGLWWRESVLALVSVAAVGADGLAVGEAVEAGAAVAADAEELAELAEEVAEVHGKSDR
jgi:hypothetical protein